MTGASGSNYDRGGEAMSARVMLWTALGFSILALGFSIPAFAIALAVLLHAD